MKQIVVFGTLDNNASLPDIFLSEHIWHLFRSRWGYI